MEYTDTLALDLMGRLESAISSYELGAITGSPPSELGYAGDQWAGKGRPVQRVTDTKIKMMPVLDVTDMEGDLREEITSMADDFDKGEDSYITINTVADEDVFDNYPLTKAYIEESGYGGQDVVILIWW
jgi:hypothetical protein